MFISTVCTSQHLFHFKEKEVSGSADDISINVLEEGQSSETVGLLLDLKLRRECVCIILNRPLCELLCSTITAVPAVLLAPFSDTPPRVFRSALAGSSRTHPPRDTMSTGFKFPADRLYQSWLSSLHPLHWQKKPRLSAVCYRSI